jgi:hypothetical protein
MIIPRTVRSIVKRFMEEGGATLKRTPQYKRRERCYDISLAFMWFARSVRKNCGMLRVGIARKPFTPQARQGMEVDCVHWVSYFPSCKVAVDWTAQDFWDYAPCPWFLSLRDLLTIWSRVAGLPSTGVQV